MSLADWLKAQWLKAHKTSRQEIGNLLGVADRDLRDCQTKGLSDDARLAIAYNAALQCAVAALAACGYLVIESRAELCLEGVASFVCGQRR